MRKRIARVALWIGVGLAVLALVAVAGVYWALHRPTVQAWLLRYAAQKATAAAGLPVSAQSFSVSFHGVSPTLTVYGLRAGTLVAVPQLSVQVQVISLLHRQWYLASLTLERPLFDLECGPDGGCNLPRPSGANGNGGGDPVFQLSIRNLVLHQARIVVNERAVPLSAEVRDLEFHAQIGTLRQRYTGNLRYADGRVQYGNLQPLPHSLDVSFSLTPDSLTLTQATLASAPARLALHGSVDDFNAPRLNLAYDLDLNLDSAAAWTGQPSVAGGVASLRGTLTGSAGAGPLLQSLTSRATLSSPSLTLHPPGERPLQVSGLHAQLALANGNLNVTALQAGLLGGDISGGAEVANLGSPSGARLTAQADLVLHHLQLQALAQLAPRQAATAPVSGQLDGKLRAGFTGAVANLTLAADLTAQGNLAAQHGTAPFRAALAAKYDAASQRLTLDRFSVRSATTQINAQGTLANAASAAPVTQLTVDASAGDLSEVAALAALFAPRAAQPGLAGSGEYHGTVSGSLAAPQIAGRVTARNVQVRGTAWSSLAAQLNVGPQRAAVSGLQLVSAGRGSVTGTAALGLRNWSPDAASPLTVALQFQSLPAGDLAQAAGAPVQVGGLLNGSAQLNGTLGNPQGTVDLTLRGGSIAGQPVTSLAVTGRGQPGRFAADVTAQLPAGQLSAQVTLAPGAGSEWRNAPYTLQLSVPSLQLAQLAPVAAHLPGLEGVVALQASGSGTLDNPALNLQASASELRVQQYAMQAVQVQASVANHAARVTVAGRALNTPLQAQATVGLTGAFPADVRLDTGTVAIAPLLALLAPGAPPNLGGRMRLTLTATGPLRDPRAMTAQVTVPELSLNGGGVSLAATGPLRAAYQAGVVTLAPATLRGTDTEIEVGGRVPLLGGGLIAVSAHGTVNLQLLQLVDTTITSSGELRVALNAGGTLQDPVVQGSAQISGAALRSPSLPLGMENGTGSFTIGPQRIAIDSFSATLGGGTLTASGGVTYRPAVRFALGAQARRVRLMVPNRVRETLSADLALGGNLDAALLSGRVTIADLSLTPGTDLSTLLDAVESGGPTGATPEFEDNLRLDVELVSAGTLHMVSPTFSAAGDANLHITGTAADPVVLGRLDLSNGDAVFEGNRYLLQSGSLEFANPTATEPTLNLTATTNIQQYNIQIALRGPADLVRTSYTSDPSLPQSDIINLLAFGSTAESSAANPTPGTMQAENVVASQLSGQVTGRVQNVLGLSQLSVDPELGNTSGGAGQGARITVQKRVTGALYVTFSTDTSGTQREVVEVQYQLSPRVQVTAVRDQNGGFALLTTVKKKW